VTADYDQVDFFTDESLNQDPYPYFDHLRSKCPVTSLPHYGVVAVSGYDEITDVYRNVDTFSSCNAVVGPFATFSEPPVLDDDISEFIALHRHELPMNDHMVTMDPPDHTRERSLVMRLLTPKRLKQNEDFMRVLSDRLLDEILPAGRCEFISAYSQPFAMLVVADVLGVPEEDQAGFRERFGLTRNPGELGGDGGDQEHITLNWLDEAFEQYIVDRRREPREDVLTQLALGTYPDGSTPDVTAVVRTASFLFAAGQETTARLLAAALKYLSEYPELQDELRAHKERVADFIDETLRLESPVKADFRLARRPVDVGGVEIAPGTPVMLLNGAANRDPRRFECPHEFQLDRSNASAHLAFGRGPHSCPGGPLARAEGRISIERILDRMHDIRLVEEHHGPPGDHRYEYEPTWILRGLRSLHIEFTPAES
jgi:cytochrome P450